MEKLKVGVLFGGLSNEHSISCISANSIINALDRNKYEVFPIGITKNAEWLNFEDTIPFLSLTKTELPEVTSLGIKNHKPKKISTNPAGALVGMDVVFPVLHGSFGEDGEVQAIIQNQNIAYVGSGVESSRNCMDKTVTKTLLEEADFKVGQFININENEWFENEKEILTKASSLGYPVFVKPARAGSSLGIQKIKSESNLKDAIEDAREVDEKIIIEKGLENTREIECGVISEIDGKNARASLPAEIIVKQGHDFYDFEAKYLDDSVDLIVPAKLSDELIKEIQTQAVKVFKTLNCQGLARVDFFITKDEQVIVNEVNTMPGFTSISMFPRMWTISGLDYPALVEHLVKEALSNKRN